MPDRGKLAVVSILLVAVAMAGFAWYYRWQHGRRVAEFWGPEAAELIRGAERSELLALRRLDESPNPRKPIITIGDESRLIQSTTELGTTPGLIHARHSLLEDASFEWMSSPSDPRTRFEWSYAIRFANGKEGTPDYDFATVAFDFENRQIMLVEEGKTATVVPRIADGWQKIIRRATESPRQP